MKTFFAILLGFFSGLLIYLESGLLLMSITGIEWEPGTLFVAFTLVGGWTVSAFVIRRGARGLSNVFNRGFLIGAAEWLLMIPIGLVVSGRSVAEIQATSEAGRAGAILGGGFSAIVIAIFSLVMAAGCFIAFLISYFLGNEIQEKAVHDSSEKTKGGELQEKVRGTDFGRVRDGRGACLFYLKHFLLIVMVVFTLSFATSVLVGVSFRMALAPFDLIFVVPYCLVVGVVVVRSRGRLGEIGDWILVLAAGLLAIIPGLLGLVPVNSTRLNSLGISFLHRADTVSQFALFVLAYFLYIPSKAISITLSSGLLGLIPIAFLTTHEPIAKDKAH